MYKMVRFPGLCFVVAAVFFAALPAMAQEQAASSTVPVTTVVTVIGPKYTAPPAVGKNDVAVYQNKDKQTVTSWVPAQGDKASLQLAIIIDDSDNTSLGGQFGDITSFIKSLPASTAVGIYYASNGTVQTASNFSADHDAVAKKLRMPFGNVGAYSSLYLSLMDFMKRWPVSSARREIFVIADGIDRFRGDPFSPDVDSTIRRAQMSGIMIHTIYASGVGYASRNFFRVNNGQSNLARMADGTGGESFFQGTQTPISFAPFLSNLDTVLKNQYWLSFTMNRSKKAKGDLQRFRVRTELKNVEISAPDSVFVPGT
ncbi:MAG: hypothetical protein ACRD4M_10335 [Candidatus Acidiferrales bacterium]